jgi:hypothetical protein
MKHLITNPFSVAYSFTVDAETRVELAPGQSEHDDLPASTLQAMRDGGMMVEVANGEAPATPPATTNGEPVELSEHEGEGPAGS